LRTNQPERLRKDKSGRIVSLGTKQRNIRIGQIGKIGREWCGCVEIAQPNEIVGPAVDDIRTQRDRVSCLILISTAQLQAVGRLISIRIENACFIDRNGVAQHLHVRWRRAGVDGRASRRYRQVPVEGNVAQSGAGWDDAQSLQLSELRKKGRRGRVALESV